MQFNMRVSNKFVNISVSFNNWATIRQYQYTIKLVIIKEMTGNYKNYKIIFLSALHYEAFKIGLDWSSEFD